MATPIPQNRAPFTLDEITEATSGRVLSLGPGSASGVATDTRESLENKVFVALRGERFDGHRFLDQAIGQGASVLVVEEDPAVLRLLEATTSVSVVLVEDTLRALGDLALAHRVRWGKRVVAIGGSAGKTTTRSVVTHLLEPLLPGRVLSTHGNLNNRIGVPMMLFGLEESHELAVLELGTNQRGEMAELSRITRPDVALLTLIDLEHTDGLGDLDGVEQEEAALFTGLSASSGVALGWGDDPRVARQLDLARVARRLSYQLAGEGFATLRARRLSPEGRSELQVEVGGRSLSLSTSLLGRPGVLALLAGLSVVEALLPGRLDEETSTRALENVGEPGRGQLLALSTGVWVLDDTYNANPASVESSIETGRELVAMTGGRLFLVLGEMLELGRLSRESHEIMGEWAASSGARLFVGIQGDARFAVERARSLGQEAEFVEDAKGAALRFSRSLVAGDVVVVKGSRGVRSEQVVLELVANAGRAPQVSATSALSVERVSASPPSDGES